MSEACQGQYGHYIVQELSDPNPGTPEFQEMYKKFSKRILWIDGKVVPGAFQMNTAWYHSVPEWDPVFEGHAHDSDELIGFFGSDPEDPYNLHAEIEIAINGREARQYASQGQQRSLALAMKLSEGEISKQESGEYPVFLLDDVLSELDVNRRAFVLSAIKDLVYK